MIYSIRGVLRYCYCQGCIVYSAVMHVGNRQHSNVIYKFYINSYVLLYPIAMINNINYIDRLLITLAHAMGWARAGPIRYGTVCTDRTIYIACTACTVYTVVRYSMHSIYRSCGMHRSYSTYSTYSMHSMYVWKYVRMYYHISHR